MLTMTHALSRCLELVHLGVCIVLHKFLLKVCTSTGIIFAINPETKTLGEVRILMKGAWLKESYKKTKT